MRTIRIRLIDADEAEYSWGHVTREGDEYWEVTTVSTDPKFVKWVYNNTVQLRAQYGAGIHVITWEGDN